MMCLPWLRMEDIAQRLICRKRHWLHGPPTVSVEGEHNQLGKLKFTFPDQIVEFGIYLQDKQKIEDIAKIAVSNINDIQIFMEE